MKGINKYTWEQFKAKYEGKRHISCGINYDNGDRDTVMGVSFSQIVSIIAGRKVVYIASK